MKQILLLHVLIWCMTCRISSSLEAVVVPPPPPSVDQDEQKENDSSHPNKRENAAPRLLEEQQENEEKDEKESAVNNNNNKRCRWGEPCFQKDNDSIGVNLTTSSASSSALPFVPPKMNSLENDPNVLMVPHKPPEGFVLTARVYTDSNDKLAHFDDSSSLKLPYWECGASGSTTLPLQVKHAYFRHALGGKQEPKIWSGSEYGPHPHLVIPLTRLELVLNSGESRIFSAGDVILLEDVLSSGHVIRGVEGDFLDALIITLPQHYHHVGKERTSLFMNSKQQASPMTNPCPTEDNDIPEKSGWMAVSNSNLLSKPHRQVAFGAVGAALSSMTALFLTKVAPLWLSVGIGGTCFVVGGTGAAVICGEAIVEHVQTLVETKKLQKVSQKEDEPPIVEFVSVEQDMEEHVENPILEPEIMDHLMDAEENLEEASAT